MRCCPTVAHQAPLLGIFLHRTNSVPSAETATSRFQPTVARFSSGFGADS